MGVRRSPRFCLIQRCSVSFSRKFHAGIVPDARLFLLQSALLCRECGTFCAGRNYEGISGRNLVQGGIIYLVLHSHLMLYEVSVLMKIYVAS
jgi:hypothetical protein